MSSIDRMYRLVAKPIVTEKGSNDQADRNAYHFRVPRDANKVEIRQAVEKVFGVKVESVNTRHCKDGKHAIIKLDKQYSAEEIGMNIGIF